MPDHMRTQFTFYRSYYDAIRELPKKEQTSVLLAICAYALDSEEPKLSGTASAIFTLVRPTLDVGRRKAMGGRNGTPAKDSGKMEERHQKDPAKEKEKEKEREGEKEKEEEREDECPLPPVSPPPGRHRYGKYANVLLSDEDLEKLKTEFPDWEARIERLSEYIASKGAKYKNHLATIRAWARKDAELPHGGKSGTGFRTSNPFLELLHEMQEEAP